MRTKNLKVVAVVALFMMSVGAFAQNGRFSVGLELGLPTGDDADVYSSAIGGSVRYEMPMGDNIGLTGSVGYLAYMLKSEFDGFGLSLSSVPILLGAKYYFVEQQNGFYAMAQLGVTSTTAKVEVSGVSISASSTDLTFGPGVGYHLENLDFGANYNIISASGSSSAIIGFRIAYVFGAK